MDTYCFVPDCGQATIVDEYDPGADALRRQPEMELFCLQHYRSLIADRKARAAADKARCDSPNCDQPGALYAGGRRCKPHAPVGVLVSRLGLLAGLPRTQSSHPGAGHELTGLSHVAGRPVVDVELPAGNLPIEPKIEKNLSEISPLAEVTEMPGEPILYSTELAADDPRLNSTIKSALKVAKEHGWRTKATVAISNDELFSILVKFRHPTGKQLTTRHERPAGKTLGFKVGWLQYAPTGAPNKVGWREAMVFLKGEDPLDDRPKLIEAMGVLFDAGADVVRVEVTA